jgi:hypothetical protein
MAQPLATFNALAEVLDERVGESLRSVLARGRNDLEVEVEVTDLHAVSPGRFLQMGDAVLHDLSYQQARHLNQPLAGVYVANPGYMLSASGVPRGAVIVEVNGQATPGLASFVAHRRVAAGPGAHGGALLRFRQPAQHAAAQRADRPPLVPGGAVPRVTTRWATGPASRWPRLASRRCRPRPPPASRRRAIAACALCSPRWCW